MKSMNKKSAGGKPLRTTLGLIAVLGVLVVLAAITAAQPTSFLISGEVNDTSGNPVNNPIVTVTNLNTDEVLTAKTDASSNYYQVVTSSFDVSAEDVLHFDVSNSGSTEFNHTATQAELNAGGFAQNATIEPTGICGDVDGLPGVTTNDGRHIFMHLLYPDKPKYSIDNPWAADCDGLCDGITTNDGRHIFMHLLYPDKPKYFLNCSC